jgi:hypothetical protein
VAPAARLDVLREAGQGEDDGETRGKEGFESGGGRFHEATG